MCAAGKAWLTMDKKQLRKTIKSRISGLESKADEARMIMERIKELPEYREARTVLAFIPLPDEPDIMPLLADDPRVLFPYIEDGLMHFSASDEFHMSSYGAMEAGHAEADYDSALMLVPLLGYSRHLQRLGRGGGFYDRYIAANRERIITAGIAFSISLLEDFEGEDHDAVLDMVITPDSVVRNPGYASL